VCRAPPEVGEDPQGDAWGRLEELALLQQMANHRPRIYVLGRVPVSRGSLVAALVLSLGTIGVLLASGVSL
jgi:hypothetical protein